MPIVKIAVISDLHCRLDTDPNDSIQPVGALRKFEKINPFASLRTLIAQEGLTANLLLNPGDFANKARKEGLQEGWTISQLVGGLLGVSAIVPVIGNHDIISRREGAQHPPFYYVQNLDTNFPFTNADDNARYFGQGFCTIRTPLAEIIALNTVIEHVDEQSAKRGTFSQARIADMEQRLGGSLTSPLRIALMHHHPIVHSGISTGDNDVLEYGDSLLAALGRLGCKLVVHGHKHEPRLTRINGITILASGSFSANLHQFGTSFANTFHIISIDTDAPGDLKGTINTWAFHYGHGWSRAGDFCGLPYLTGFGNSVPLETVAAALRVLASGPQDRYSAEAVREACPSLDLLTPAERDALDELIRGDRLSLYARRQGETELYKEFTA